MALAVAAVALVAVHQRRPASPRARAEALHADGLVRIARGDATGANERFDRALEVDSTYVPALLDRLLLGAFDTATEATLRGIRDRADHPLRRCADAAIAYADGSGGRIAIASDGHTACDRWHHFVARYATIDPEVRGQLAITAYESFPETAYLLRYALGELVSIGAWQETLDLAQAHHERSEVHRVLAIPAMHAALHHLGRHSDAFAAEREASHLRLAPVPALFLALGAGLHASVLQERSSEAYWPHADSVYGIQLDAHANWRGVPVPSWRFEFALSRLQLLVNTGQLSEALSEAPPIQALADSLGSSQARGEVALVHGRAAVKAGRPALAEQRLLAARAVGRQADVPRLEWEVSHNLMHLYESTGRDSLAVEAGLDFAAVTQSVPLRSERMMAYHDLAMHMRQRGRWAEAQHWFELMVPTIDSLDQGHTDFFAGEYFESTGQLERALTYYGGKALNAEPTRTLPALVRISELLGDTLAALRYAEEHDGLLLRWNPEGHPLLPGVLARLGLLDSAATMLQRARDEAAGRDQRVAWGRLTTEQADVELRLGRDQHALALADSAVAVLVDPMQRASSVRALASGAIAAARLGRPDAARRLTRLTAARRTVARTGDAALAANLGIDEGDALVASGDTGKALLAYQRAQSEVDSLAAWVTDDATRTALLGAQRQISGRALALALQRRNRADAVVLWQSWSDRRKAQTLERVRPVPRRLNAPSDGRVVLDFALLDSTIAVLVLRDGRATLRDLEVLPSAVARHIDRLYETAAPRVGSTVDAGRARLDQRSLTWLSSTLLTPLLPDIGSARRIEFVPDGFLYLVPFDVLPLGDEDGLVLDRFVTSLSPSLRMAGGATRRDADRPAVIVAGPPRGAVAAPGAREEADRVRHAIRSRSIRLFAGSSTTESAVRDAMTGAGIIHLAAHAKPNASRPDLAEVWLGADSSSDGRLQAFEIRTLDLTGATIVLSACETGAGPVAGGEGPLSLARAFLQAGASEVVATMWPVRESAAQLMAGFHTALDAGADPAVALREARLTMLRNGADLLTVAPYVVLAGRR